MAEGRALPVTGTQEDGNNVSTVIVSVQGAGHFGTIAEVGGDEACADKQENKLGRVQLSSDLLLPV